MFISKYNSNIICTSNRFDIFKSKKIPENVNLSDVVSAIHLVEKYPHCSFDSKNKRFYLISNDINGNGFAYIKDFIIKINIRNTDFLGYAHTILHELRHLYQYEKGIFSLKDYMWNGVAIDRQTCYSDLPWEIDAEKYAMCKLKEFFHDEGSGPFRHFDEHECR